MPKPLLPPTRSLLGGCLLLGSLVFGSPGPAFAQASAWTRAPGEALVIIQGSLVQADELFSFDGQVQDYEATLPGETAFRDTSLYMNAEFGVIPGLTVSLDLPYKITEVEDASFVNTTGALGDISIGARFGLFDLLNIRNVPFVLALEPRIKLPAGYTRNLRPSAGAGQLDLDLHLAVGAGLPIPVVPGYVQARIGYRLRTSAFGFSQTVACPEQGTPGSSCFEEAQTPSFSDEILYGAELGLTPLGGSVVGFFKVNGLFSVNAPDRGFDPANPIPERQRFLKVGGGGIIYPLRFITEDIPLLSGLGLLGQYFATPDGQNTIKSDDLFGGIIYQATLL